jgi:hypothetical protein
MSEPQTRTARRTCLDKSLSAQDPFMFGLSVKREVAKVSIRTPHRRLKEWHAAREPHLDYTVFQLTVYNTTRVAYFEW